MIKLKNLMNESMGLGDLPSTKLMKMKMTLSELEASEKVESVINESPSSEELDKNNGLLRYITRHFS